MKMKAKKNMAGKRRSYN